MFCFKILKEYPTVNFKGISVGLNRKKRNVQFETALFICQLGHVFAPEGVKKDQRLKGESSIFSWFHFPNFLSFLGHVFIIVSFCLMIEGRMFYICVRSMSYFFIY